jgi:hypothetical protein
VTTTAEERVPIARLRAGSPIEGVFACTRALDASVKGALERGLPR